MSQVLEYEKGWVRTDRGQHLDKGNWGVDPAHPDFTDGRDVANGVADARDAFARADTFAQLYGLELRLTPGTYSVGSNVTVTSPVRFTPGAALKPASGVTITLNGFITAGLHQIFDQSAGGLTSFGANVVHSFRPEWWGAKADGTTDSTTALSECYTAIASQRHVSLSSGTYIFSSLTVNRHTTGAGREATKLQHKDATSSVAVDLKNAAVLRDVSIFLADQTTIGVQVNTDSSCVLADARVYSKDYGGGTYAYGTELVSGQKGIRVAKSLFQMRNVLVGRINGTCVSIESGTADVHVDRLHVFTSVNGVRFTGTPSAVIIEKLDVAEIAQKSLWITGGRQIRVNGFYSANVGPATNPLAYDIYTDTSDEVPENVEILNCWAEQTSTRSFLGPVLRGRLTGKLFNVELSSSDAVAKYWRIEGNPTFNQRSDAGVNTAKRGSLHRTEEDNPVRAVAGVFTGAAGFYRYNELFTPATAGWNATYAFESAQFENYTQGQIIPFTYRAGETDKIIASFYLDGDQIAAGVAILDAAGTVLYGEMVGNAGSSELALSVTVYLTSYDANVAAVTLTSGTQYFIVPCAKAAGASRTVRRSRVFLHPMNARI